MESGHTFLRFFFGCLPLLDVFSRKMELDTKFQWLLTISQKSKSLAAFRTRNALEHIFGHISGGLTRASNSTSATTLFLLCSFVFM